MSIEMPAEQVRALGRSLVGRAATADDVRARLIDEGEVEGPLRVPVALFLDCHHTLADALAGELRWLGTTVIGIADAWVRFDGGLLASSRREPAP
ncbi:hypothetical protein DQ239_03940 [Blastococcus sp. TF02-09]|uniref:hypothetical protein n=1 Tax=Blastococcus sp. TF02-09 TaxID=2250576 RepID=UPI000DE96D72|nr:hypothetical protein [Blastococcus sp. TF02-9]RBY80232.1 hypothetical protein DQ239_03940 [Blastococcus sp. TF02-9]